MIKITGMNAKQYYVNVNVILDWRVIRPFANLSGKTENARGGIRQLVAVRRAKNARRRKSRSRPPLSGKRVLIQV